MMHAASGAGGSGERGLEIRIQRAAFAFAMFLVAALGAVIFVTQAISTQRARQADLAATLEIVANDIRLSLNHRADSLAELSKSPLIWTALTDSMGRDAYLRPFLASQNASGGATMAVTLLDYKGNWISGDRSLFGPSANNHHDALTQLAIGQNKAVSAQLTTAGEPHLLLAFPVRYAYSDKVAGVLVGNVSLTNLVKTRIDKLTSKGGYRVNLGESALFESTEQQASRYNTVTEEVTHPDYPELYRLHIELFGLQSPWLGLILQLGGMYLLTAALLIWAVWRVSGLLAGRLTQRLNRLSGVVRRSGTLRAEDIPVDAENDEISALAETLRTALEAHARVTQGLESLVAERTFDLVESQKNLKALFELSPLGIALTDISGRYLEVNDAFLVISGYSLEELRRLDYLALTPSEYWEQETLQRQSLEKIGRYGPYEKAYRQKNGHLIPVRVNGVLVHDKDRQPHIWSIVEDITEQKNHLEQLEHIAHFDALTGLPNRVLLADRLHLAMAQAQRRRQQLAVVYLDLDGFKAVNDKHGHDAGDEVLVVVSSRMQQALRESDTLARLGGDEFVAVMVDLTDIESSVPMLVRLLAAAASPVPFGDVDLTVSASIGVTFYPQMDDVDADQLLRQADQAMYQAKLAGKNRYHVFDSEQDRNVRGYHESLERIRLALVEREFVLYYQPKVNMRSGEIVGAEALIRWQHPQRGLLPPGVFLPVIEDHPLAIELGEWVIDTALTQMEAWHATGLNLPVSVNVGARQLQQADFMDRLRSILNVHPRIKPDWLELEVLETSALEDIAKVSEVIQACKDIGVSFALDDFGTGYSSLTYLKRLPAGRLKIDQSFIRDMLDDPDDLAILEGVLGLAGAFRREVIAEGVETVEHGVMLLQLGYELAQGYGIAYPMPAHELPAWAAAWRPDPAWANRPSISRDDLSVLYASVEHRAWIAAVGDFLNGSRIEAPVLDRHHCRFGKWLDTEGHVRHGAQEVEQAIESLHDQVHVLAAQLLELMARGEQAQALARLDELHQLRDSLLEQLKIFIAENPR